MKTGWWKVNFDLNIEGEEVRWADLSEATQEHILKLIQQGFVEGEIIEDDHDEEDNS